MLWKHFIVQAPGFKAKVILALQEVHSVDFNAEENPTKSIANNEIIQSKQLHKI